MSEISLDQMMDIYSDPRTDERVLTGDTAPAGSYTATCYEAEWLMEGDDQFPNRTMLKCRFVVPISNTQQYKVSFKMDPRKWRKDPSTKESVEETDQNRPSIEEWQLDLTSKRWRQAESALMEIGAIGDVRSYMQVADAMTRYPLTFRVGVFERDGLPRNYVQHIRKAAE